MFFVFFLPSPREPSFRASVRHDARDARTANRVTCVIVVRRNETVLENARFAHTLSSALLRFSPSPFSKTGTMCDLIEHECVKAERDLLAACRQSLAHGALLATRYALEEIDFSFSGDGDDDDDDDDYGDDGDGPEREVRASPRRLARSLDPPPHHLPPQHLPPHHLPPHRLPHCSRQTS